MSSTWFIGVLISLLDEPHIRDGPIEHRDLIVRRILGVIRRRPPMPPRILLHMRDRILRTSVSLDVLRDMLEESPRPRTYRGYVLENKEELEEKVVQLPKDILNMVTDYGETLREEVSREINEHKVHHYYASPEEYRQHVYSVLLNEYSVRIRRDHPPPHLIMRLLEEIRDIAFDLEHDYPGYAYIQIRSIHQGFSWMRNRFTHAFYRQMYGDEWVNEIENLLNRVHRAIQHARFRIEQAYIQFMETYRLNYIRVRDYGQGDFVLAEIYQMLYLHDPREREALRVKRKAIQ